MENQDQAGRFTEGNRASPGRPPRQTERDFLDAIKSVVSADDMKRVARKALALAIEGDAAARRWLSEWSLPPKPKQSQSARSASDEWTDAKIVRAMAMMNDTPTGSSAADSDSFQN